MSGPLVSCLCVTEGRPEFMPWLLWGFDRQTYARRELVIVDSSTEPFVSPRPDVRVIVADPGTNVPTKRNLALGAARGAVIAWFDDDDWQHPARLEQLVEALSAGALVAGNSRSWFVDLFTGRCQPYDGRKALIFNGAGFSADLARKVRFNERAHRASDTIWLRDIKAALPNGPCLLDPAVLSLWLCHGDNLSNPRRKRKLEASASDVRRAIGAAWDDTDARLDALRANLPAPDDAFATWRRRPGSLAAGNQAHDLARSTREAYRARRVLPRDDRLDDDRAADPGLGSRRNERPAPAPRARARRESQLDAVTLLVTGHAADSPHLPELMRKSAEQAQHPFIEQRLVVLPSGEEANGLDAFDPHEPLTATLAESEPPGDEWLQPYVSEGGRGGVLELSARARRELFAVARARSDLVLMTNAWVFLSVAGSSWVASAAQKLEADSKLWFVMPHAGPPCGAPDDARTPAPDDGRAHWDKKLKAWRLRAATLECFLLDRRKLLGALDPPIRRAESLGEWMAASLRSRGAYAGMLAGSSAWGVHVTPRELPIAAWPARMAESVQRGVYPAAQFGRAHVALDDGEATRAWLSLLESTPEERPTSLQND
jgi:hypothetical protein